MVSKVDITLRRAFMLTFTVSQGKSGSWRLVCGKLREGNIVMHDLHFARLSAQ